MRHLRARFWWILVLRGIVGILLGIASLWLMTDLKWKSENPFGLFQWIGPAVLLGALILLLGLYAFFDGIFDLLLGLQNYGGRHWWGMVFAGLLSISLGFLAWSRPETTIRVLLYWIAAWALWAGLLEIGLGVRGTEYRDRRGPFFYGGLGSVVFGLLLLWPGFGAVQLVWLVGLYAVFSAVPLLALGFHLRHFTRSRYREV